MPKPLLTRENASIMEFELSRRNGHRYLKKSYCLPHSRVGASAREGTRHHWRSGERKEAVEKRDSWALTQDRLYQDCQATHWKVIISPLDILWTPCGSGLVTRRTLSFWWWTIYLILLRILGSKEWVYFRLLQTVSSWSCWTMETLPPSSTPQSRPVRGACFVRGSGWKQHTVFQNIALHSALLETQSKDGQPRLKVLVKWTFVIFRQQ